MKRTLLLAFLLSLSLAVFAACLTDDSSRGGGDGDEPASATPDTSPQPAGDDPLHSARLDLAERRDVEPLDITIAELRHAGWDGCYGIRRPDSICPELFVGGVIAIFESGDNEYRYHLAGGQLFATDFIDGITVGDGSEVPVEMQADLAALMAGYARGDLALRLRHDIGDVVVTAIAPDLFSGSCAGFLPDRVDACDSDAVPGAYVFLLADSDDYRYHVLVTGKAVATDFEDGEITQQPDPAVLAVQEAMRADLATRLGSTPEEIAMKSFREVTWPDGCLGVQRTNEVCTQALVDGFWAELTGSDGKVYVYHGADSGFIATDFEDGATIQPPLPRGG